MIKILVCEDDKDLNRFVTASLRNMGYDITSCFDGEEGLEATERVRFDMILTDIMMPKMDGFELAKEIRSFDKDVPIIFMTAKDDKPSKMFGYSIGIDDYVTKPFDMDVLRLKINAVLRRARVETQKEIRRGNFVMNTEERTAVADGEEISGMPDGGTSI